ncbi:uncharacterized protein LOC132053730 [Lycium ferocissimum]|uniref:uncharacterized protein LOC132053730 n=1 Tax=Lycium ferocissimum TaxID=112874 RepID=UPI0028166219|nr:uncharacterized protein LOC132053730 [Lycium ferocissimum]
MDGWGGGDFNVILDATEKFGGFPVNYLEVEDFAHCLRICQSEDLGFSGSTYTWWNGRADEECFLTSRSRKTVIWTLSGKIRRGIMKVATLEEVIKVHEAEFEHPTKANRVRLQKVQADLIRVYAVEEKFWKQMAGLQWFKNGDRNTKFFHAYVNGKRKRLQIKKIQDQNGVWLEQEEEITQEAIRFYSDQFSEEQIPINFELLDHIHHLITT